MRVFITGITGSLGMAMAHAFQLRGNTVSGTPKGLIGKPAVEQACEAAMVHGSIQMTPDLLILNDGINHLSHIGQTPEEDEDIMNLNVMSQYWTLNWLVARNMLPQSIIFIASQTHRVPQRTTTLYCASKAAVVQMSRVVARELGPKGVQVNAFCPGKIVDTQMSEQTDAQVRELRGWTQAQSDAYAESLVPMGRFTSKAEVAEAIYWMSLAPRYLHGSVIDFTGGV